MLNMTFGVTEEKWKYSFIRLIDSVTRNAATILKFPAAPLVLLVS